MKLVLDSSGNILEASPVLRDGVNVIGTLHGFATPSFELVRVSDPREIEAIPPSRVDATGPLVFARNGLFEWVAPDITATRDLFYGKISNERWMLSDDFFCIARVLGKGTIGRDVLRYFISHGYLPPGATFLEEIARARPGIRLVLRNGALQEEDIWFGHELEQEPRTYETFKRAFSSVFETYPLKDQAGISLSAGCDSGLVAAVAAVHCGKRPHSFTIITPQQPLPINDIDEANAWRVAKHLDLKHTAVEFDYNEHHVEELRPIVRSMPLAAHLSLHFFKMVQEAANQGVGEIWYGQSADSVYNLGPTQKSLGGPLRRFYLTKEYWQGFPDVMGNKAVGGVARVVGSLGPIAWRFAHKQHFRQPGSFEELMGAFADATGTPPFPKANESPLLSLRGKQLSTQEARERMFDWKLQAFLTGKDTRVLRAAGERHGVETALPYTASNMLHFFRGLEMSLQDVFSPKRFIYRYVEELLGKKAYQDLYRSQEKRVSTRSSLNWKQWQEYVLSKTTLGQEMGAQARQNELLSRFRAKPEWNPANFQHVLSLTWTRFLVAELESRGVVLHSKE